MRIGLTGGIASGKSTASAWWAAYGALLVDTDALARELTQVGGAALPAIARRFGKHLVHPQVGLDRVELRRQVLAEPQARKELEAILHPLIQARADGLALQAAGTGQAVVFDVPLLVESPVWRSKVDRVLLIDCDENIQIQRGGARPGWTVDQVRAIVQVQAPRSVRRAAADATVDNSHASLERLHQSLQQLAMHWRIAHRPMEESRP